MPTHMHTHTHTNTHTQADAYKVEVGKDKWQFGVRGAWLLAPTRFGAHNWESTGMLSALAGQEKKRKKRKQIRKSHPLRCPQLGVHWDALRTRRSEKKKKKKKNKKK